MYIQTGCFAENQQVSETHCLQGSANCVIRQSVHWPVELTTCKLQQVSSQQETAIFALSYFGYLQRDLVPCFIIYEV